MNKKRALYLLLAVFAGILVPAVLLAGLSWRAAQAAPAARSAAAIRYVAPNGTDTGDCRDSTAPCASIQYAVDVAAAGDEIRIATVEAVGIPPVTTTARYVGTGSNVIFLDKSLTLSGGYVYAHATIPPVNTWQASPVPALVDGEGVRRGLAVDGNITVTVRSLAFVQGHAERGGNVYARKATLTLVGTPILSGTATYGGGMYLEDCRTRFEIGDLAQALGADYGGVLPVQGNSATYGGGVYVEGGNPLLTGLGVFQNEASASGGGMYLHEGAPILGLNVFLENQAVNGGGLYLDQSAARILGAAVLSNTASNGAGAYFSGPLSVNPENVPLIANAYVRHNVASSSGGGFYFSQAVAGLLNNVVADNAAGEGAGMYLWASSPQVYHNTVAQNTGSSGIFVTHKPGQIWPPEVPIPSYPSFTNTMVVSHSLGIYVASTGLPAPLQNRVQLDGALWSGNGTDTAGNGQIVRAHDVFGDPRFTCTGDFPDCLNPYHILTDSAALDAGVVPALPFDYSLVDIDLQPRPSGTGYDIGADEIISDTYSAWLLPPLSALPASPGGVVTHTHTLLNSGRETDTYDLALGDASGTAVLLASSPVTLAPGMTETVMVRVSLPPTAATGTTYRAVVTATSRADASVRAYALDLTAVAGPLGADLQIRKTADRSTMYAGEAVRYTLTITRQGALSTSQAVTITDMVQPPEALASWQLPSSCTGDTAAGVVTCTLTLPPFAGVETHTLSVMLTTTDVYTGLLLNSAAVLGSGAADPAPDNNSSYALVGVRTTSSSWLTFLPIVVR